MSIKGLVPHRTMRRQGCLSTERWSVLAPRGAPLTTSLTNRETNLPIPSEELINSQMFFLVSVIGAGGSYKDVFRTGHKCYERRTQEEALHQWLDDLQFADLAARVAKICGKNRGVAARTATRRSGIGRTFPVGRPC